MKAVQIVNPSEMKVVELEKPAVGVGEVLVRIKYVGFCGSVHAEDTLGNDDYLLIHTVVFFKKTPELG